MVKTKRTTLLQSLDLDSCLVIKDSLKGEVILFNNNELLKSS